VTLAAEISDGRRARGQRSRTSILEAACDLASVEGLDGLTIGGLAKDIGMSKSGLFAHFGSKEELQLATHEHAVQRFRNAVIAPGSDLPAGRARLEALLEAWLGYMRSGVFRGGCFFNSVRAEFDARPTGPVRRTVVAGQRRWRAYLADEIRGAREAGELGPAVEPVQLAYELDALGSAADLEFQLLRDPAVFDRAGTAFAARLG
jgi:AcrR family transcriptional regulator